MSAALFSLLTTPARADANTAKAKQLFEEGVTNYNLSHFEEALNDFEMAYRLKRDPAFLFNIAQCERNLRRYDEALRTYRAYLRESPDLPPASRAQIQQIMSEMERARAEEKSRSADLEKEKQAGAPPSSTQPPAPATASTSAKDAPVRYVDTGRSKRLAGIITADVGVGVVALGVVFAVLSKQSGDAAYHPSSGVYDLSADQRQKNYRAADIACFVVGGAAVATGVALWLVGRKERHSKVTATASVLPGSAAASLQVAF